MAEEKSGGFTPAEARRLVRFLQRLGREDAPAADAATEVLLARAEAAGLVARRGGVFEARPEARSFLRRLFAADGEADFAAQHGERVRAEIATPAGRVVLSRNLDHSPLAHLARLRGKDGCTFLSETAVEAGEALLADFTRAQMQPRVTASWEPRMSDRVKGAPGGQAEVKVSALAARERFNRAVEAMGPELSGVVLDVCCFHKGLEVVERERQWPARSAKLLLRAALMVLARHYAPPAPRQKRQRHWGDADYRPGL